MKRLIGLIIAVVICFVLVSCQKEYTIEQCITYADEFVKKTSNNTEFYNFKGYYEEVEEKSAYGVVMSVDEDYIVSLVNSMDMDDKFRPAVTTVTLDKHDTDYETIESIITDLKSGELEEIFKGKDVTIMYGYIDRDGEITWY